MKRESVGPAVLIESLDQEGRGVARVDGKVIFIEGALPGEVVEFASYRRKPKYEFAEARRIVRSSVSRVVPRCRHFGVCGGCSMQHLEPRAQVAAKQRVLEENLARIGRVTAETMLSPIQGPTWEYRYRARFSARYVARKGALVGFRERHSSFVVDMQTCEVVPARISALLVPLQQLIASLSIRERLPQVELAIGDAVDVLVLRVLEPPDASDQDKLKQFAVRHQVQLFLQPKGPDSIYPFFPLDAPPLQYRIPDFDLVFPFNPTDFTQVNHEINRALVRRVFTLLDPQPGECIGDFFCGLGNFSLAIARSGAQVTGIEGSPGLLRRARENAVSNGLEARCRFVERDLFTITGEDWSGLAPFDRLLIDPPRDGAIELVKAIGEAPPARIVYVSCSPATLARDAAVLVHSHGYRLTSAGVVNMFPHTSHVESVALFETA
jgi:23S rRNA (uracil1939-C5)-methyltransferase